VDHVIEFIGKSYWTQNLNVLRRDGVMVYLAFMSGPTFPEGASIAPVSFSCFSSQSFRRKKLIMELLFKRLTLKGSTLRSRDAKYQQNLLEKFEELALPLLKEKKMKIEVHEVRLLPEVARIWADQ
jgi:NADPH:quinone reductase-like Zn-dependent oxidoreductase